MTESALSVKLSQMMDVVFGNEDHVKCRRAQFLCYRQDEMWHFKYYIIGSKAEGLCIRFSDTDYMYVINKQYNIEYPLAVNFDNDSHLCAIYSPMSSSVRIHLNKLPLIEPHSPIFHFNGRLFISSSQFVDAWAHSIGGNVVTVGPSNSRVLDIVGSTDNVVAFQCHCWPSIANEWIHRNRNYSWPSPSFLSLIKSNGCHFVPIGEQNSIYRDLEWRVSFVVSECVLVRSFNHVQLKIYGLLKRLKTTLLQTYKHPVTCENLITSYHMKTVMFWVIENTPTMMWIDTNIIKCVKICLGYLKHFLQSNYLPNYFIPKANLFYKHTGNVQSKTNVIMQLDTYDPVLLINTSPVLQSLSTENMITKLILISTSTLCSFLPPIYLLQSMISNCHIYSDFEFTLVSKMLVDSMYGHASLNDTQVNPNKHSYSNSRILRHISLMTTHFDAAAGWLHLSAYYYMIGQYNRAAQQCTHAIQSISSTVIYAGSISQRETLYMYVHMLEAANLELQTVLKHTTASLVHINKRGVYPSELNIEVRNIELPFMVIPPLPYANFILFLCANHLYDGQTMLESLNHLESLVHHKHYGVHSTKPSTYIIFNMIGICYELFGDKQRAAQYYKKTLNMKDSNNQPGNHKQAATIRLHMQTTQEL